MKVGVDTFTLRTLKLDPFQTLDYCKEHELEGALFGGITGLSPDLDRGRLREIRQHADSLGLYSHVSVGTCNPYKVKGSLDDHRDALVRQIEAAAAVGWHEVHSSLGSEAERYEHPVPWTKHLADSTEFIRSLGPALKATGSRINLETHGDTTTFEVVRIIEAVGPDVVGFCLDTANVILHAEDPLSAIRRAAPYTHLTHVKDAIVYFSERGYSRQGRPPGQGVIPWEQALPVLAHFSPHLPLCIEDHKWIFHAHIFEGQWIAQHPDLTPAELGRAIRLVWQCQQRIISGEIPEPDDYEAIPWEDQMLDRLHAGRDFLKELVQRLGI